MSSVLTFQKLCPFVQKILLKMFLESFNSELLAQQLFQAKILSCLAKPLCYMQRVSKYNVILQTTDTQNGYRDHFLLIVLNFLDAFLCQRPFC